MTTKTILGVIPGLQATAMVGHTIKHTMPYLKPSGRRIPSSKLMVRGMVGTMTGVALIKPTAQMINDF